MLDRVEQCAHMIEPSQVVEGLIGRNQPSTQHRSDSDEEDFGLHADGDARDIPRAIFAATTAVGPGRLANFGQPYRDVRRERDGAAQALTGVARSRRKDSRSRRVCRRADRRRM